MNCAANSLKHSPRWGNGMHEPVQDWQHSGEVETQVERMLEQFSLEDKIKLVSGQFVRSSGLQPPAGLPAFNLCDGPAGIRTSPEATNTTHVTALPAPIALAATWSTELAHKYGDVLGLEAKLTGHNVLLGPAIDMARAPLAGRTFESFGEDPLLQSRMVVPEVQAIQAHGVQTCLKHFIVNNQEHDRNSIDVRVDERTLHEIYLPPFEAAIKLGGAASVMGSYNRINGTFACENPHVLSSILRDELGFRGWVMSDFLANQSTVESANAGLEWELTMPFASRWREKLLEAVQNNQVTLETLNEMVRRILRPTIGLGMLESGNEQPIPIDEHAAIALEIAEQSIVLLKNTNNLLPLSSSVKSIAVIGADADNVSAAGGGSALVKPPLREIGVLQGLRERAGSDVRVEYAQGTDPIASGALLPGPSAIPASVFEGGLQVSYWNNVHFEGEPVLTRLESSVDFIRGFTDFEGGKLSAASQKSAPIPPSVEPRFSARWTGILVPSSSGNHVLSLTCVGLVRLFVDEQLVLEVQSQLGLHPGSLHWNGAGAALSTVIRWFEVGKKYAIRLEYVTELPELHMLYGAQLRLEWQAPAGSLAPLMLEAVELARRSDVAVIVARTLETEFMDRGNLELPNDQAQLIRAVNAVNLRTVVVLMTGSSLKVEGWEDAVPAILEAWYPGQEQGHAVARVLFGDVNPSGKLPLTFPRSDEFKMPSLEYPGSNGSISYFEGLKIGYRGYDQAGIEPKYPFGFGLSYTTFAYSNLEITSMGTVFSVCFDLKNKGGRDGVEIAQVYLDMPASADAPPKKLVGWARVLLQAGEQKSVMVKLDSLSIERPFSRWNEGWQIVPGAYRVFVGRSSREMELAGTLMVNP
jgi:beta-glucosidase